MTPTETRALEAFPSWLKTLADDAQKLAALVDDGAAADAVRERAAAALNYLFKSLDLIPDGLEDIGFIDDAFVFRAAAASLPEAERSLDATGTLSRLAADAALIEEFLGEIHPRLSAYVGGLGAAKVRGRSVSDVLADPGVTAEFTREVRQWADGYQAPAFHRDDKNLVKLRSFLNTKLK